MWVVIRGNVGFLESGQSRLVFEVKSLGLGAEAAKHGSVRRLGSLWFACNIECIGNRLYLDRTKRFPFEVKEANRVSVYLKIYLIFSSQLYVCGL